MGARDLLLASAVYSAFASTAMAAETRDTAAVAEVVVVTGSYIRGTAEDAALPVDVISSVDLEKRGSPSTLDILKQLNVSNGVLGDSNQFDARSQFSEGTGTANLRGLGPTRTLVLLNGRRLVSSPFVSGGPVDTNLIPSAAIDRIEVLKDGAAATYGSDAIAGVVNFITKQNFNGLSMAADYKYIQDSDGDYTASLAYGGSTDDSHWLLTAGYQHRSELMARDRDFATRDRASNPQGGWSAAGNPGSFVPLGVTSATPLNPLGSGATFRDPQCSSLGGEAGASGTAPVCYWQFTQFDALTEKEERYQAYAEYDRNVFSKSKFHVEALFSGTEIPIFRTSPSYPALQTPSSTAAGGTSPVPGYYYVPANNPGYIDFRNQSAANAALLSPTAGALVVAQRPFGLGGNPYFGYDSSEGPRRRHAFRISTGLSGSLVNEVGYDVAVTYMKESAHVEARDTVVNREQLALRGLGGPNCNVAANTPGMNGCLWLNPFASAIPGNATSGQANALYNGAIDNSNRELVNWMFPLVVVDQDTDIFVVDAVLNGTLGWSLPGGEVGWATGVQYRDSGFKANYSDLYDYGVAPCVNSVATGIVGPSACTPADLAAPAGALIYLAGGSGADLSGDVRAVFAELSLPILDSLQAQIAARYEDYGGQTGSTFDPKLSLRWQVFDAVALRGSVGTSFRGPALTDVNPSSATGLQSLNGLFRTVRTFGNPGLEPESATTFNVGMLVSAGPVHGSLDYWSFDFDKPITVEPLNGVVNAVFGGTTGACDSPLIGRFAFGSGSCNPTVSNATNLMNVSRVDSNVINGSKVQTTGWDLGLQVDIGAIPGGDLAVGLDATRINKYAIDSLSITGSNGVSVLVQSKFDAVGKLNYQTTAYPLPKYKGSAYAEYEFLGVHNLRYQLNYIDAYVDQRFASGEPGQRIGSTTLHNLYYRWQLPADLILGAAIENVTDRDPPLARLDMSYDPFTAAPFGRTYKVGVSKKL